MILKNEIRKKIKLFTCNNRGVAAIEFAMVAGLFFMMVFFIVEMSRVAYISGVLDLASSEGAKMAKNFDGKNSQSYKEKFSEVLYGGKAGRLWRNILKQEDVNISVSFVNCDKKDCIAKTIDKIRNSSDMSSGNNISGNAENAPIAIYRISYHYKPMFFPFASSLFNDRLVREVVFVQEYERSEFSF